MKSLADNRDPNSLATKLRKRRFLLFRQLLELLPQQPKILDVGGTEAFWIQMGYTDAYITLLNLTAPAVTLPNTTAVIGDARAMPEFLDSVFIVT